MPKEIYILGIESSCDETGAAIACNGRLLSNVIATQEVHRLYGGVIPEMASRAHQKNIVPCVANAISEAGVSLQRMDGVAVAIGPGLIGSLLVGASFAKGMAFALGKPLLAVHHMKAHAISAFINNDLKPAFPYLCLNVSGGHTQIVLVNDYCRMETIGRSLDDAAGEAFDKAAKILGLPYPGGPLIDTYSSGGDRLRFRFPVPKVDGFNFSFSGLKTSFLYFIRENISRNPCFISENLTDICASIQGAIIHILLQKLEHASIKKNIRNISIAGGVASNSFLRNEIKKLALTRNWTVSYPGKEYCTDNAAMIAFAGYHMYRNNDFTGLNSAPKARIDI